MKISCIVILFISGLFMITTESKAQSAGSSNKMSVYYELWGNGMINTVNIDLLFRIDNDLILVPRIGIGTKANFLGRGYNIISVPLEFTALLNMYHSVHFMEVGPGFTIANMEGTNLGFMAIRAGYRYQPKNGWFMMRVGIVPMMDVYSEHPDRFEPNRSWNLMAGISVGVAF